MKRLSTEQIVLLHDLLIKHTGGLAGIRDKNLLESAAHAPFATYDGKNLYSSIENKAARLGFGLAESQYRCFSCFAKLRDQTGCRDENKLFLQL